MLITVAPGVGFDSRELEERFIRASGPGGQNVNKVSSAVQVRLDLRWAGSSLPEWLRARVERLEGRRVTGDGVLVLTAQVQRSQERNRADALGRVVAILRGAAVRAPARVATRPSQGSRRARVEAKVRRGALKRLRGEVEGD